MERSLVHLGIIMDGNRRWAKENGLSGREGHKYGAEKVRELLKWCKARDIRILTLYAFSTENWDRHKKEVNFLMELFGSFLKKELSSLNEQGIGLKICGRKNKLSPKLQRLIGWAEEFTDKNNGFILNLAISYGGRAEIVEAVKKIIAENIPPEEIDEAVMASHLWTKGLPDPDLIIRTGGERRLSNFLTWQSVYSELYFCEKYWPDFSEKDLDIALADYYGCEKRLGR